MVVVVVAVVVVVVAVVACGGREGEMGRRAALNKRSTYAGLILRCCDHAVAQMSVVPTTSAQQNRSILPKLHTAANEQLKEAARTPAGLAIAQHERSGRFALDRRIPAGRQLEQAIDQRIATLVADFV
jgi:hypothetical protein